MKRGGRMTLISGKLGLFASIGTQGVFRHVEVRDTKPSTILVVLQTSGFEVVDFGIVLDQPGTPEQTIRAAMQRVAIVTSGGISMGEFEFPKPIVEQIRGGMLHFGRVNLKPGKPTTLGTVPFESHSGERKVISNFFAAG